MSFYFNFFEDSFPFRCDPQIIEDFEFYELLKKTTIFFLWIYISFIK